MSEEAQESPEMGTKPKPEHEWLQQLVGDWTVTSEMIMGPDQPPVTSQGTEKTINLGGLWAFGEGTGTMPDGGQMEYRTGLGYDVSFNEYRGFWLGSVSSHLWKYVGTLSEDGKTMTLNCVGPDMVNDGQTANYRDMIEILDANHRTLTSYGEGPEGVWTQFMKATYTRN